MDQLLIKNAIEKLEDIAEVLYKGNVQTGIANMNLVLSDIAVISTWITDEQIKNRLINDALTPAIEAMQEEDGIQLADIITYEIIEIIQTLK